MNKFTTGLLTGGALAAAGLAYLMRDKKSRRKLARDSKKIANKANEMIDSITDF